MTIYVDTYHEMLQVPKKWQGGGHLVASDLDELHAFATGKLGLKREWYQNKALGIPHYDLTKSKRSLAIAHGAVVIEPGYIPDDVIRRDDVPMS